jgi:hypothetical protein
MKKTREIKGVVCGWKAGEVFIKPDNSSEQHLVKLGDEVTIQCSIPERKVEISESEWILIIEKSESCLHIGTYKYLYQKLFGKVEENL